MPVGGLRRCWWVLDMLDSLYSFLFLNKMRGLLRLAKQGFSSKKLGIADTAKVIQDKIMNITQVVSPSLARTMSRSSVLWSASVTVLPVLSASTRSRLDRWSSSDQALEEWPSISKLTTSVSSSSEMIGIYPLTQRNPRRRYCHQNRCHRRCPYRRRNVGSSLRCLGKPYRWSRTR